MVNGINVSCRVLPDVASPRTIPPSLPSVLSDFLQGGTTEEDGAEPLARRQLEELVNALAEASAAQDLRETQAEQVARGLCRVEARSRNLRGRICKISMMLGDIHKESVSTYIHQLAATEPDCSPLSGKPDRSVPGAR